MRPWHSWCGCPHGRRTPVVASSAVCRAGGNLRDTATRIEHTGFDLVTGCFEDGRLRRPLPPMASVDHTRFARTMAKSGYDFGPDRFTRRNRLAWIRRKAFEPDDFAWRLRHDRPASRSRACERWSSSGSAPWPPPEKGARVGQRSQALLSNISRRGARRRSSLGRQRHGLSARCANATFWRARSTTRIGLSSGRPAATCWISPPGTRR